MKRFQEAGVAVVSLVNAFLAASVLADDVDDWDDEDPAPNLALYAAVLIEGERQARQPVVGFKIDKLDFSNFGFSNFFYGEVPPQRAPEDVIGEIRKFLDETSANRQTLVDVRLQEVSRGDQRELGIDAFANGALITTDFANGSSNQQILTPNMFSSAAGPTPDLIYYSHQSGEWRTQSISAAIEQGDADARGTVSVPWLPPGARLTPPNPGNLIVLVSPTLVDEDGLTRRPPRGEAPEPAGTLGSAPQGPALIGSERSDNGWTVSFNPETGYVRMNLPSVGAGTHIIGPDEIYALKSPEWIDGFTVGGTVSIPLRSFGQSDSNNDEADDDVWPSNLIARSQVYVGGTYVKLSGDSDAAIAPNTDVTGITFPNLDSPSGFTGIGLGVAGLLANMEVDYEAWQVIAGGGYTMNVCGCSCTTLTIGPRFGVGESDLDHDTELRVAFFPDNIVSFNQSVETFMADFALQATVTHRLNRSLALYGTARAGGYYYDADGSSRVDVQFPLIAPPDDFFVSDQSDSESGVGFRGGIEGGMTYRLARDVSIYVAGGFEYLSDMPHWRNPQNPAEPVATLETDDAWTAYAKVGLRFRF